MAYPSRPRSYQVRSGPPALCKRRKCSLVESSTTVVAKFAAQSDIIGDITINVMKQCKVPAGTNVSVHDNILIFLRCFYWRENEIRVGFDGVPLKIASERSIAWLQGEKTKNGVRLILIGKLFSQNFLSLKIIEDMYQDMEAFCLYSGNSPAAAKIYGLLNLPYLFGKKQENLEDWKLREKTWKLWN